MLLALPGCAQHAAVDSLTSASASPAAANTRGRAQAMASNNLVGSAAWKIGASLRDTRIQSAAFNICGMQDLAYGGTKLTLESFILVALRCSAFFSAPSP